MHWELDAAWFGGWSGIEMADKGNRMTAMNDRGQMVHTTLQREDGKITGVAVQSRVRLRDPGGSDLRGNDSDSEGLAIADDGSAYISFEQRHRIMQVDLTSGRTFGSVSLPFDNTLGSNSGIEALAVSADGTLFAIPEQPPEDGGPFPVYTYHSGVWQTSAYIPQRGPFVPVGADFDPMGRLWLLERAVTPLGFRSRIRLFVIDPVAPREFTVLTTAPLQFDNLEGISVWQDDHGQLRVTMVSDDNFLRFLRTQIVEFSVIE